MERFPRGTLPPSEFAAVATRAPNAVARPPKVADAEPGVDPARDLDFSTTCPNCTAQMLPEHAHYKCPACGYRDSSSF
jgi:rubredoxin